ncbi:hypothetical protein D3C86_1287340 [compost metagenome]
MASGTRLSDVIVKLPDRSTCRVERRMVVTRDTEAPPVAQYVCTLPTGEAVTWLGNGKYRLPTGAIAVAVAHKRPENQRE